MGSIMFGVRTYDLFKDVQAITHHTFIGNLIVLRVSFPLPLALTPGQHVSTELRQFYRKNWRLPYNGKL